MTRLIFYCPRENRYSISALAGALQTAPIPGVAMTFAQDQAALKASIKASVSAGARTVAAVSILSCQQAATALLMDELRGCGALFIAGGAHTSAEPESVLRMGFDYAVTGEGEETLLDLLKAAQAGSLPPSGVIRGRPLASLDLYPPYTDSERLPGPLEITRGCPFGCGYCQTPFLFGGKPRHRSVPAIMAHIGTLIKAGETAIRFITPDAFAYGSPDGRKQDLAALEELLSGAYALADKAGAKVFLGSFPSEVRPEHVTPGALETAKKYVSNRRFIIGAQTGSPRLLKAINRGHTAEDTLRAGELCRAFKFWPEFDFIFGLPGETPEDEDLTMDLIKRLEKLGGIIHTHAFMPLPGTPLAGAPGAQVSARMEKFISALEGRGHACGPWRTQRKIAHRDRH